MYNDFSAYAVELYCGEMRSGKTLSIVADTLEDLKKTTNKKIAIFSNFHLTDLFFKTAGIKKDNFFIIKKIDLAMYYEKKAEFTHCLFLIDEFQTWLDSRNFMKGVEIPVENGKTKKVNYNQCVSYFLGQMGKRGNVLRGSVHDINTIDVRGRLYTQKETYCFKGLINQNGIWKQMLNVNRVCSADENDRMYIQKITYIKKLVKTSFLPVFKYVQLPTEYIKASDYFPMYDTMELI